MSSLIEKDHKSVRSCPVCGKPEAAKLRPFCSKRCANVDLNRWLSETYAIPANETPSEPGEPTEE